MASVGTDTSLECPVCLENFTDPRILPCGHTACLHCLVGLVRPTNKFRCPVCRLDIDVPEKGIKSFITNFAVMNLLTSPKCKTHKKERLSLYCNDCNVGICGVCIVKEHQAHNSVYVEDDSVKLDTIQKLKTSQQNIEHKIQDLQKTYQMLEDQSKKLKDYDKKCRDRVIESYNRKMKELEEKKKNELAIIDDFYDTNELTLSTSRNQCQQQKLNITQELEQSMPSLLDDNNLKRVKCVKIMSNLESKCNAIEVKVPNDIQYLVWKGNDKSLPDDVLGVSEHETLYIPSTYDFRFNINDIKDIDKNYYSQDKYYNNGITWSCRVVKYNDGYLGVFSAVREEDNPDLQSCVIDRHLTLVNKVTDKSIVMKDEHKYKTDSIFCQWGWNKFMQWIDLSDTTEGFVDIEGQFIVKLGINNVRNIKKNEKNN